MDPVDRSSDALPARTCATCGRRVYDLVGAPEASIRALVTAFAGDMHGACIRLLEVAVGASLAIGCAGSPLAARPDSPVPTALESTNAREAGDSLDFSDAGGDTRPADTGADARQSQGVQILVGTIRVLQQVRFARGSTSIGNEEKRLLDETAELLVSMPDVHKVLVRGHTSKDEAQVDRLSAKRAEAVIAYLAARGVDRARLQADTPGGTEPLEAGDNEATRAKNRRVEFRIVDPAPSP